MSDKLSLRAASVSIIVFCLPAFSAHDNQTALFLGTGTNSVNRNREEIELDGTQVEFWKVVLSAVEGAGRQAWNGGRVWVIR